MLYVNRVQVKVNFGERAVFFFFDGKPQITLSLLRITNPHGVHQTGLGQQLQEGCLPPISDTLGTI